MLYVQTINVGQISLLLVIISSKFKLLICFGRFKHSGIWRLVSLYVPTFQRSLLSHTFKIHAVNKKRHRPGMGAATSPETSMTVYQNMYFLYLKTCPFVKMDLSTPNLSIYELTGFKMSALFFFV
jgi:hypothetical protein